MELIFEKSRPGRMATSIPKSDVPDVAVDRYYQQESAQG